MVMEKKRARFFYMVGDKDCVNATSCSTLTYAQALSISTVRYYLSAGGRLLWRMKAPVAPEMSDPKTIPKRSSKTSDSAV